MSPDELQLMLNVQSRAFKDCLEIFTSKYEKEINELKKHVFDLERSIEFKDKINDDLMNRIDSLEKIMKEDRKNNEKDIEKIQADVKTLHDNMTNMESRQDYQDDQSRRNNIRKSGLPEDQNETWEMTQQKVATLLKDRLELPEVEIERAHRTGRRKEGKPRQVVAKLLRYNDREAALRNASKLKPPAGAHDQTTPRIFINEDLCPASVKKRQDQLPQLTQARKDNKFARFVHTKLVIRENSERRALGSQSTWGDAPQGRTTEDSARDAAREDRTPLPNPAAAAATAAVAAAVPAPVQSGSEAGRVLRSGTGAAGSSRANAK